MIAEEIIKDVQTIFGDKHEVQIEVTDWLRWLNDGQLRVAKDTGFIQRSQQIDVTEDDFDHPLNQDFLKFVRVTWDGMPLLRSTSAELDEIFKGNSMVPVITGTPTRFFYRPGIKTLFLYPSPDVDGSLEILYTARPVELVSTNQSLEVPPESQPVLKEYLLAQAYELDENFARADSKKASFDKASAEAGSDERFPHEDSYSAIRVLEDDAY